MGGRARTELYRGFRLDRSFQVLLTEYPETKKVLDYEKLKLRSFEPGPLVRFGGKFHRFVDPWREPKHIVETALSPVASFADDLPPGTVEMGAKVVHVGPVWSRNWNESNGP